MENREDGHPLPEDSGTSLAKRKRRVRVRRKKKKPENKVRREIRRLWNRLNLNLPGFQVGMDRLIQALLVAMVLLSPLPLGSVAPWARSVLFLCACLLLVLGCSTESNETTAHLSGSITIGGEQIPPDADGQIRFIPTHGGQAAPSFANIHDGKYDAPNVPKGEVTVTLHITRKTGRMVREDNVPTASPHEEREDLVPPKYRSGLQIEVQGNNDGMDFDL